MKTMREVDPREHRTRCVLALCLLVLTSVWAHADPTVVPYLDLVPDIVLDSSQDLIVTGTFSDSVDLGGGPLVSTSGNAMYLGKLALDGTHQWSQHFEIVGGPRDVQTDASGNVVVCGTFEGTLNLGGSDLTSNGQIDMFLAKFDPSGTHLWSLCFGDALDQRGYQLAVDPSGNVILAGAIYGSLDLGGGVLTSAGVNDILLAKFDPAGTHLWSQIFGDASYQDCVNPVVDDAGNIVIAGHFMSTVDFGGGLRTSSDAYDLFLAEFSPAGALNWDLVFSGPNSQVCKYMTRGPDGTLALTGDFSGSVDLGGGLLTPVGVYAATVGVFDADGVHQWSAMYGPGSSYGRVVALDDCGNLTLTGHIVDTVDFGGGPLTSAGSYDAFTARFDATGRHLYSRLFGDADGQFGLRVLAVDCDEIVASAWYSGLIDLGGGTYQDTGDVLGLAKLEFGHVRESLDDGLVAHWSFDTDFTATTGGAGFDGVAHNGPSIDTYGRFGGSAYFERANLEYVDVAQPVIVPGQDHSYSAWYKLAVKDIVAPDRYFILEAYPSYPVSYGLLDGSPSDLGQVYTHWGDVNLHTFPGAGGAVWHNILVTYDADDTGSEHKIYLDGALVSDMASTDNLSAVSGLIIGSFRDHDDRFWDGWIDDVAVWDRVLTEAEITALQASPVSGDWVGCTPDSLTISLADDLGGGVYGRESVIRYLAVDAAPVYGYSVDVTWDPLVLTATKDDFSIPDNGPFHDTLWFIATDIPGGVRVNAALPGGSAGVTSGELFKVAFTAASLMDYTTGVIDLSILDFRDADNQPITGVTADDGMVVVDLVAPAVSGVAIANTTLAHTDDYVKDGDAITVTATVTDTDPELEASDIRANLSGLGGGAGSVPESYLGQVATWTVAAAVCDPPDGTLFIPVTATDTPGNTANDDDTIIADNTAPTVVTGLAAAPGHKKVELTWTDAAGQDAHYDGVIIRYAAWAGYPEYTTAAPDYPDGPAAGDGTAFDGTGAAATHAFASDDRDIYAYAAYAYDLARNYSPVATSAQDIATNYWLGDVGAGAGPYDGHVDVADYTGLASSYGLEDGDGGWKPECDVGPTDDHSGVGLPEPDDQVQFEDLIIFAMNAGVASGKHLAPTGTPEPMLAWERVDATTWSLRLREPCADLKGVNVAAQLPAGSATVSPGALLAQQEAPTFLQNIDRHGLDVGLALLGRGLGFLGSGELLRVRTAEEVDLTGAVIMARGIENTYYGSEPVPPGDDETPPVRLSLAQNMPNPFNPSTKIVFSLPEAQPVRLTIYTPDGKRVRTLVSELRTAGVHEVIWNGRDDHGRVAASGTYLYRLQAGPFVETRKMSLMK